MRDRTPRRVVLEDVSWTGDGRPLRLTTDVSASEWDDFVTSHPDASAYHDWAWRDIIEQAFGHETLYLAARRDGRLCGVLPLVVFDSWLFGRFLVSLPFVNYGGTLADSPDTGSALVDRAARFAEAEFAAYVELRHRGRRFPSLPARTHKVAMTRSLPDSRESAWLGLDRKARNQIREAERSGLTVERGGRERLHQFYAVFAHNMRDLGTPVYSRRFFDAILSRLPDRASCVIVSLEGTPVAAAVTLRHRDTVEVPWASALKQARATCPNHLLYWTIISDAIAAGVRRLDFGRSSPDSGTYRFKQQWGAEPEPLHWEYALAPGQGLPDLAPSNPRLGLAISAWKQLPLRVATLVGPHIVRSIP